MATEVQFACALVVLLCCGCAGTPTPSITTPTSNPNNCTTSPYIKNGHTGLPYNDSWIIRYYFNCSFGYKLEGQPTTTCIPRIRNGTIWTNGPPSCVKLNITTTFMPTSTSTTPTTTGTSFDAENTTHTTHRPIKPTGRPINLLRFGYTPWAIITLVVIILLVVWIVNCCMGPMF
ncbi:membrane protein E3 [Equid gammaherpesvirus 2]|nr:membrane protein E3 [Equid gammaherpesvirus 2]